MLPGVPCGCQVYYVLSSGMGPRELWVAFFVSRSVLSLAIASLAVGYKGGGG